MQTKPIEIPNSFTIKRFVPLGDVEAKLKQNPSAKVYREVVITVGGENVVLELSSVTREAATGGYRNGSIDGVNVTKTLNSFLDDDVQSFASGPLSTEPFAVLSKVLHIRDELAKAREAVCRVIGIMSTV